MKKLLVIFFIFIPIFVSQGWAKNITGVSNFIPWSGYWWPTYKGELVNGYNGHPSSFEKYDLITQGIYPGKLSAWALSPNNGVYNTASPGWHGYCHAWANAAILEDTVFFPSVYKGVYFSVGDKKGILTALHAQDQAIVAICRYEPLEFHRFLLAYIKNQGIAIAADLDPSNEMWTYPIYKFSMDVTEGTDEDNVCCTVSYASDFVKPDFEGTLNLESTYTYKLKKDSSGNYISGEWTLNSVNDHPDSIWIPVRQETKMPIDYLESKKIITTPGKGFTGTTDLAPGKYRIILKDDVFVGKISSSEFQSTYSIDIKNNPQSPSNENINIVASKNSIPIENIFSKDISLYFFTNNNDEIILRLDCKNSTEINCIDIYIDVEMNHTIYCPDISENNFWKGFAVCNNNEDNFFYGVILDNFGNPHSQLYNFKNSLAFNTQQSGLVSYDKPLTDTYRSYPSTLKITSNTSISTLNISEDRYGIFSDSYPYMMTKETGSVICSTTSSNDYNLRSDINVFNPLSVRKDLKFYYYKNSGKYLGSAEDSIDPYQTKIYSHASYSGNFDFQGWALVESESPLVVKNITRNIGKKYKISLPTLVQNKKLCLPHVPAAPWVTILTLINPNPVEAKIILTGFQDGAGKNISLQMGQFEKKEIDINDLYSEGEEIEWLNIASESNISGAFSYRNEFGKESQLPLLSTDDLKENHCLPHIASDDEWWTGISITNPNPTECVANILAYAKNGTQIEQVSILIPKMSKNVSAANSIFKNKNIGSARIISKQKIYSLAIYGDSKNNFTGLVLH